VGEQDWITAVPNRPLVTGDNLWADKDSRAELHIGSTAIRLNSETSLTMLAVNDRSVQLRLALGTLIVRVRHIDDEDSFEVDTPNLAFTLLRNGEYRIEVNPDGNQTTITVLHGRGQAIGGGQDYSVLAGQQVRFTGTDTLDFDIEQIPQADDFDTWARQRDDREDRSEAANYVSREMTGYDDLDDHGRWRYVANYGYVWAPTAVPPGWAPYRFGHWVWIAPWGWTWVDDAPWGFAPFHYGRWVFAAGAWCWSPGPVRVVRPVYAPALVAFVGGGGFHFSVSFGVGPGVAWFPLGPGEVFVPMYRTSRVYVTNVNVTNTAVNVNRVTNVYNSYTTNNVTRINQVTYVNQHVTNGVTAVSRDTFVNARPVARNAVQIPAGDIARAPVTHMAPVTPVRASVLGAGEHAKAMPPPAVMNRQVLTNRPVPASMARPSGASRATGQPVAGRDARPVPRPAQSPQTQATGQSNAARVPRPQQGTASSGYRAPAGTPGGQGQQASTRPLARPAPPVQPKSQQQWAKEESKFQTWQQQRQNSVPRPPQSSSQQPNQQPRQQPMRQQAPRQGGEGRDHGR
jgi:hypothetical protein